MTDNISVTDYLMAEELKKYINIYNSGNRYLALLLKHRRTSSTINTYASTLRILIRGIGELRGNIALQELTESDLYDLVGRIPGKEATVRGRMNVLGGWLEFETGQNPIRAMKLLWNPTEPKRTFISTDDFETAIRSARNETERMILRLGAKMGLRMSEISAIRLGDINGDFLTIYGKGHGKGKVVEKRIPAELMRNISEYIANERKALLKLGRTPTTDALLVQGKEHKYPGERITNSTIISMYDHLSRQTKIHLTSHMMRRLYCTLLANECGLRDDLDTLRRMMRHENVNTTLTCYLNANPSKMAAAENKLDAVLNSL